MARKLYEHDDDSKLPYASTRVVIADEHQAEIDEHVKAKIDLMLMLEGKEHRIGKQQAEIDTKIENWEQAEKDLSGCRKKLAKAQAEIDELSSINRIAALELVRVKVSNKEAKDNLEYVLEEECSIRTWDAVCNALDELKE